MRTPHQRNRAFVKPLAIFAASVLACALARSQDFTLSFVADTNSAPVEKYGMVAAPTNAVWMDEGKWIGECAGYTNQIGFKASQIPFNPCLIAVQAVNGTNKSAWSETYLFDTNNFVVAKQLNLFPPRFLKVTRKP